MFRIPAVIKGRRETEWLEMRNRGRSSRVWEGGESQKLHLKKQNKTQTYFTINLYISSQARQASFVKLEAVL